MKKKARTDLVSIIIPIYNLEAYLNQCIISIQNQTHKNLQIILVNDGSTDNSGDMCNAYARQDKRIKSLHQKNTGVSAARNSGIEIATGDYICFVDGDDYIAPNYVQCLLEAIQNANADIAVCGLRRVTYNNQLNSEVATPGVLSAASALRRMLTSDDVSEIAVWNKIYKRALFTAKKLSFPTNKVYSEDVEVVYKLYSLCSKVVYIDDILYFYLQRASSATSRGFTRAGFNSIEVADTIIEDVRKNRPALLKAAYKFRLRFTFTLLGEICQSKKVDTEALKLLSNWSRKNMVNILFNQDVTFGKKLRALVLIWGPQPYQYVSRLLNKWAMLKHYE